MSTHCGIGIKRKNGAVDATYCHFDGYLDGVGENLKNFFRDADKVSNLVSMGDLRGISDSGEVEAFDDEVGFDDKHFRSVEEFLQSDLGTLEYTYLFDEDTNRWYFLGGEDPETDIFDGSLGMYHLDRESLEEDDKSTFEIFRRTYPRGQNSYEVVIDETIYRDGRGRKHSDHKTYKVYKNGEQILFTSVPQTYNKCLRNIEAGKYDFMSVKEISNSLTGVNESEFYVKEFNQDGTNIDYVEFNSQHEAEDYASSLNKKTGHEVAVYTSSNDECISLYDKLDEHSLKDLVADNDSEAMRKLISYCENFGTNEVWEETLKQLLKYVPEDVIENYIHYELNDLVSDEAPESITDDYFDFHNGNY